LHQVFRLKVRTPANPGQKTKGNPKGKPFVFHEMIDCMDFHNKMHPDESGSPIALLLRTELSYNEAWPLLLIAASLLLLQQPAFESKVIRHRDGYLMSCREQGNKISLQK
jgi:hypothetical protein